MHGSKLGHILLLGALSVLPGCLAINAALGVLGAMGPPAAQLAGAAYTVAEYSYEYGAHQRTPDEVFMAKFDWLTDDGDEPDPAAFAGALSAAMPGPQVMDASRPMVAVADAGDVLGPVARPNAAPIAGPISVTRAERPVKRVEQPTPATRKAAPAKRAPEARMQVAEVPARPAARESVRTASVRRTVPIHTYVAHAPDPLLARLNRLENGLAQAEALYLSDSADGLRLSVPPCDGDPCAQGVNGGSSLRLPVTHRVPATSTASAPSASPA
jgi:hypothetical protein